MRLPTSLPGTMEQNGSTIPPRLLQFFVGAPIFARCPEDRQQSTSGGCRQANARFRSLNFEAFSKQDWKLFDEIYCLDVVVFPDAHQTHGIKKHPEDMVAMFGPTPNLRITASGNSVRQNDYQSVIGLRPSNMGQSRGGLQGIWGAAVVSRNDRVTFRADLTVCARKHTDKSGLLKMGGAPNSAEIHYLTVAPGSHNAEVEGSSPSLTIIKIKYLALRSDKRDG